METYFDREKLDVYKTRNVSIALKKEKSRL
jgi:hypothetical protein